MRLTDGSLKARSVDIGGVGETLMFRVSLLCSVSMKT